MKFRATTIITLIAINTAFAQNNITLTSDSDTAYFYRFKNECVNRFKLGFIEKDTSQYAFRFWSFGLTIKVAHSGGIYSGEIIRFVEKYPSKSRKTYKLHYKLSPEISKTLVQLVDSLQITSLPSDKNIQGWQHGLDGIAYFTEFKNNSQYSFKNYWSPASQDSVSEAIKFQGFVESLNRILELEAHFMKFAEKIPFNAWMYPGSSTAVIRVNSKPGK